MDFTEVFEGKCAKFSPNSESLASIVQGNRIVVRDGHSMQIVCVYKSSSSIAYLDWSNDSSMILLTNFHPKASKRVSEGIWIEVIDVSEKDSKTVNLICQIEDRSATAVRWSQDDKNIFTWDDLSMKIWSLKDRDVKLFKFPKGRPGDQDGNLGKTGLYFSTDRCDGKDRINIWNMENWSLRKKFNLLSIDSRYIKVSPSGLNIAVIDYPLEYRLSFYSPDGKMLRQFEPTSTIEAGIKSALWSPDGEILSVITHDNRLKLYGSKPEFISELRFDDCDYKNTPIFQEIIDDESGNTNERSYILRNRLGFSKNSKLAHFLKISSMQWNSGSSILAFRIDEHPEYVVLFDVYQLKIISIIIQRSIIKTISWNPIKNDCLALTSADSSNVYIWSGRSTQCVKVPQEEFMAEGIEWSSDGQSLLIRDKSKFTSMFYE